MKLQRKLAPYSEVIVRFIRQDTIDEQELQQLSTMDIAFTGVESLDDRSQYSVECSRRLGRQSHHVHYDPATYMLEVGNKKYHANDGDLEDLSRDFKATSIVIDATTLDFAEIALLLYAFSFAPQKPKVGFVYVEPEEYVRRTHEEAAVNGAAFELSTGFDKHPIPPFVGVLRPQDNVHLLAFLGFEGGRLTRVLHEDDGQFFRKVTVVFGIPPFR